MAVAVTQGDLVAGDRVLADDAVGRRVAVDHVIRAMGAEHFRRIALGLADRAGVIEQRAELADGDRQVGAQQVFAEEVIERPPDRRLQEGDPAGVRRGVPGVTVAVVQTPQRSEEGRRIRSVYSSAACAMRPAMKSGVSSSGKT